MAFLGYRREVEMRDPSTNRTVLYTHTLDSLDVSYLVIESILSVIIAGGNGTILVLFLCLPHLRTITNTYIASLALSDLLLGLIGIPIHVYAAVTLRPAGFFGCIAINVVVVVLCTSSTFHLVGMALDKHIRITLGKRAWARTKRTVALLCGAWAAGLVVGSLPLLGWHAPKPAYSGLCRFMDVMDLSYLVFVIFFGTIIPPTFFILYCYVGIYRKILRQNASLATFLRANEVNRRQHQKKTVIESLILIVVAFFVCWYPLYTLNSLSYFFPGMRIPKVAFYATVCLSHASPALNPLIYAFGLPGFKQALVGLLKGDGWDEIRARPKRSMYYSTPLNYNQSRSLVSTKSRNNNWNEHRNGTRSSQKHAANGYGRHNGSLQTRHRPRLRTASMPDTQHLRRVATHLAVMEEAESHRLADSYEAPLLRPPGRAVVPLASVSYLTMPLASFNAMATAHAGPVRHCRRSILFISPSRFPNVALSKHGFQRRPKADEKNQCHLV